MKLVMINLISHRICIIFSFFKIIVGNGAFAKNYKIAILCRDIFKAVDWKFVIYHRKIRNEYSTVAPVNKCSKRTNADNDDLLT